MSTKTIKFIRDSWIPKSGDRKEYGIEFSIVDTNSVGKPDEATLSQTGQIVVGISGTLESAWRLNQDDLKKVLFEYAKRHIQGKVIDNTLSEYEEIQLSTYNTSQKCPFEPSRIENTMGTEYQIEQSAQSLPEKFESMELAAKIIDLRDNINAVFDERFKGALLYLPQERGLLELFKACNTQEEFAYRVVSLCTLVTSINTTYIKSEIKNPKSDKPLDLFGAFLRQSFPHDQANQIMDTFQAFNWLRRMYPTHTDSATGVIKAIKFFDLNYPIVDFKSAWLRLLKKYSDSLTILLDLIKSKT